MTTEEKKSEQQRAKLKKAAMPLIKYLHKNYHPHFTAMVTANSVELVQGIMNIPKIIEHIK